MFLHKGLALLCKRFWSRVLLGTKQLALRTRVFIPNKTLLLVF